MKHIYVTKSEIEGMGIRIGEDANPGDEIFRVSGEMKFKINRNKRDALAHPDWIGVDKNQWIDPQKPAKFLNHSCNPNSGMKGKFTLVALRHIKQGEEITIDYSIIEGDPRWEMKCSCGEKNCRGLIQSIHSLPRIQYDKYLPYISTYFKKLYNNSQKGIS
jgi:SET domain-containing protein